MKPRPSTTILETSESSNSVVGAKTIPHEDMNLFNSLTAPRPTTVKKCSANSKMSKVRCGIYELETAGVDSFVVVD